MIQVRNNLVDQKFGYLKVLYQVDDYISPQGLHYAKWHCKCTRCGTEKDITAHDLIRGSAQSCGCLSREIHSKLQTTHGMSKTRIYKIWSGIKARCLNPNDKYYINYGKRGITIFKDWELSFESFYNWAINNGYEDNLTIDRIDNNKGYFPDNCRWTDYKTQENNRRNNTIYYVNGEKMTLSQCSDLCGYSSAMLSRRMKVNGLSIEQAMSIPKMKKGKKRGLQCD